MSRESREDLIGQLGTEVRMHQNVQDAFDEAACARLGINRSDGRALDILDQRGRMTAGELAQAVELTSGTITVLVDRLERQGYVRRIRDDEDRRRVLIELTDLARERASEIWGPMAEKVVDHLGRYSDRELAQIRDFLRGSTAFLHEHLVRIRELEPRGPQSAEPPVRRRSARETPEPR